MTNTEPQPIPAPADSTFLPGPVLLLGAPGVGKGTQAQILMAEFAIPQISTGDLLRDHRARHTDLGNLAENLMAQGVLVPDDLVNKMVADRLTHPDVEPGFILDGFPRTLPQAEWLDQFLSHDRIVAPADQNDFSGGINSPVIAISIVVDYDELLHRITGRRTCPVCRSIYNVFSNPPRIAGTCDLEGAQLIQRSDDSEEVFVERMKTFDQQTAPVVAHYRKQGRFQEVNGDKPVDQVTSAITEALKRLRAKRS